MLTARADGRLHAETALTAPFMAPRLQGAFHPDGRLSLALWGGGELCSVEFGAISGPFIHAPNCLEWPGGGLFVAQSAPAIVIRGGAMIQLSPALHCAPWHITPTPEARLASEGARRTAWRPWGVVIVETRGDDVVVAGGADHGEAEQGLTLTVATIVGEARAHVARCDLLPDGDPMLRSMVMQGAHAALSSIRRDALGAFAGLAAGLAYSTPARTYFRDGYWTAQLLLRLEPEIVAEQIDILARGVRADGEAPSGVIVTGAAQNGLWQAFRELRGGLTPENAGDWWSDHFDSPLFFVLLIADYVAATGDSTPATRHAPVLDAIFRRYRGFCRPGEALPMKPRNDRDWADNVYRQGYVAYDLGLWVAALDAMARLTATSNPPFAAEAVAAATAARAEIAPALWTGRGWADYAAPGEFTEDHLTLDSLMLARADAAPAETILSVLEAVGETLESRRNAIQPYGDWGMLCAFPPFKRPEDLRGKTAFPFRYHNGADWPWLDGVYARELLRRALPGWRYPLTRWWESCLANGWPGAVEYFSPPFGCGSLLQGWSSYPAAVALEWVDAILIGEAADRGRSKKA